MNDSLANILSKIQLLKSSAFHLNRLLVAGVVCDARSNHGINSGPFISLDEFQSLGAKNAIR
jgi:hypothetical protein